MIGQSTMTPQELAEWTRRAEQGRLVMMQNIPLKPHHRQGKAFTINGKKKISRQPVDGSETKPGKPARDWACPDGTAHHWLCGQMTKGVTPERCKKCGRERNVVSPDYGDHRVYHTQYEGGA